MDELMTFQYASDMNVIHAMGAAVSMATGGAMAIQGGNWQIFHEMVKESKATLRLSTEVCTSHDIT